MKASASSPRAARSPDRPKARRFEIEQHRTVGACEPVPANSVREHARSSRKAEALGARRGSLGAFEHVCSPDEHIGGRQEKLYRGTFARIASLLSDNARFFLQTMVFGAKSVAKRFAAASVGKSLLKPRLLPR
jgi:hypothetical protein